MYSNLKCPNCWRDFYSYPELYPETNIKYICFNCNVSYKHFSSYFEIIFNIYDYLKCTICSYRIISSGIIYINYKEKHISGIEFTDYIEAFQYLNSYIENLIFE